MFKVNSLIPNRFSTSDIHHIWLKLAKDKKFLEFKDFLAIFDTKRYNFKAKGKVTKISSIDQPTDFYLSSSMLLKRNE